MPLFQASLTANDGSLSINYSVPDQQWTITDNSNYNTSTQDGYQFIDFASYRVMNVLYPDGSEALIAGILAADSGNNTWYLDDPATTDGVYEFVLYTVPDWDSVVSYGINNCVTDGAGLLYKSLTNANLNNILTNTTYWTPIDKDDLGTNLRVSGKTALINNIQECKIRNTFEASRTIAQQRTYNPCATVELLTAAQLSLVIASIEEKGAEGDWDTVAWLIGESQKLCNC